MPGRGGGNGPAFAQAGAEAWDAYLHLRDNPSDWHRELWHHEAGCTSWLVVERNLTTHEIRKVSLAGGAE